MLINGHTSAHNQGRHIGAVDVLAHSASRLGAFQEELETVFEPLLYAGNEFLALDAGPGQFIRQVLLLTARSTSSAMKVNMAAPGSSEVQSSSARSTSASSRATTMASKRASLVGK